MSITWRDWSTSQWCHQKHLLTETSCRVFEIAEQVGYKDYKYFVYVFKKLTGVTPTGYREYNISG
ncbi:helix-turn-helix domain-containing protein [Polycladomyces subterraneus]|uniref:AraC family transcriptional regulator n=1 Tax=Polycladomyces subterraneus TaxID=1016997 RepID=A0ABT8IKS7_9BACL|nr:helix-turn-helix domain-containing protein [Polycladomyces subterraneus]MDN4593359.1 AraC family transcriptional regulator [Polycladomyces subterraneus]